MTALERWVTVRDAIGDLPDLDRANDAGEIQLEAYDGDDDYYLDAETRLYLPRSEFAKHMREYPEIPPARGTAISLFSGCGGFDLGTTMAGFETRLFIENDKSAVETLRHNALACGWDHAAIIDDDVRKVSIAQILRAARLEVGECGIVTGGFPCQPFSNSGKRKGRADDRGNLFYECSRIIAGVQTRAFMLENVPGLLSSNGGSDIEAVCTELATLDYRFVVAKLNAVNYGVPQDRQRVFFIGYRLDIAPAYEQIIETIATGPTHGHPDSGMPTFEPIWLWQDGKLVQQNKPMAGQISGSASAGLKRAAARDTDDDAELSLFGAVA